MQHGYSIEFHQVDLNGLVEQAIFMMQWDPKAVKCGYLALIYFADIPNCFKVRLCDQKAVFWCGVSGHGNNFQSGLMKVPMNLTKILLREKLIDWTMKSNDTLAYLEEEHFSYRDITKLCFLKACYNFEMSEHIKRNKKGTLGSTISGSLLAKEVFGY